MVYNKTILSTEHGPRGGDEINLITQNSNYGWPCKSIGTLYSYDLKKDSEIWPDDLKDYGCNIIVTDPYADPSMAKTLYDIDLVDIDIDCQDIKVNICIMLRVGLMSSFRRVTNCVFTVYHCLPEPLS